jgi:molybdopterin converting factor small subunit
MPIQVLPFGQLTDIITGSFQLNDVKDTDSLLSALYCQYPSLQQKKFAIAVNQTVIHQNTFLTGNETVALLPPFSGG